MNETYVINPLAQQDYLAHYGVLGMHWGIRRYQPYPKGYSGKGKEVGEAKKVSRKTKRMAKKDAKEYANAKMFYGEGAGNRRKLINNTVKQRSKDPGYKKEFERNLELQDMAKAAKKARSTRKKIDTKNKIGETARGVKNVALGNAAAATLTSIGVYYMGKYVYNNRDTLMSSARSAASTLEAKRRLKKWGL